MRKVKRKANVGDYIEIVNKHISESRYENGDIFNVYETFDDGVLVTIGSMENILVFDSEYIVLEDYYEFTFDDTLHRTELKIDSNNTSITTNIFDYDNTINENEREIEMNKVLKLYVERHTEMINKKYYELVNKDYNNMEIASTFKELVTDFESKLETLFKENYNEECPALVRIVTDNVYKYDLNSDAIKNDIFKRYEEDMNKELKELKDLEEEVEAQLSLSDDIDYTLDVLARYNIIDKKTNKIK